MQPNSRWRASFSITAVHAEVSSVARHGQLVRDRADPGRSRLQLQPLPGIFPATVAVAVSTHASHSNSCVSRDPNRTQHSTSPRETRPHARAWRPTSPVCTATSHTRSLSHTVGHSHPVPHSYTHYSHPRGHSPAVFHTRVGVRTHVPRPARTWFRSFFVHRIREVKLVIALVQAIF